jgi:putative ABC transport system permease protein
LASSCAWTTCSAAGDPAGGATAVGGAKAVGGNAKEVGGNAEEVGGNAEEVGNAEAVAAAARTVVGSAGDVLTGAERDSLEPVSVTRVRWIGAQLLIAVVTLGAFVAVFVVASTCALGAAQRRREIGLLRAVGATPGQVRRMMYAETLVIAVLASLAGLPLGALTAPLLAGPFVAAGLEPAGFTVTVRPLALAGAFALGVGC